MKITISYIEQKFKEFNLQMFAGKLPSIPVELSDVKSFLGVCVSKSRTLPNGEIEHYDFRLRFNTRIDLPEQEVEDTIIHEMIHYYIGINNLKDTSSHGSIFKHLMNSINEKHGRHISISYKATEEEKEKLIDKKQHWHVVAIVSFKNDKTGLKVLPRNIPQIINYYNQIGGNTNVTKIELYISNNIYFNSFPNSAAINVTYVDYKEVSGYLKETDKIEYNGTQIILHGKTYKIEPNKVKSASQKYHVIAVLSLSNGKTGIKVLPKTNNTILKYYIEMSKRQEVNRINLYMSNNEYFNKYPNSGSLTYHYDDKLLIDTHLKDAEHLKCDGQSIVKE